KPINEGGLQSKETPSPIVNKPINEGGLQSKETPSPIVNKPTNGDSWQPKKITPTTSNVIPQNEVKQPVQEAKVAPVEPKSVSSKKKIAEETEIKKVSNNPSTPNEVLNKIKDKQKGYKKPK
ncbi:hypothetical protein, partial [Bacillus cereus]